MWNSDPCSLALLYDCPKGLNCPGSSCPLFSVSVQPPTAKFILTGLLPPRFLLFALLVLSFFPRRFFRVTYPRISFFFFYLFCFPSILQFQSCSPSSCQPKAYRSCFLAPFSPARCCLLIVSLHPRTNGAALSERQDFPPRSVPAFLLPTFHVLSRWTLLI